MAQRRAGCRSRAAPRRGALRDHAFNCATAAAALLSGNAANLNNGINPITLPDGSTQFIGQAQNQSTLPYGGCSQRSRSPAARSP